jgi:hypothetical protein
MNKSAAISKGFTRYGWKYPQIKAGILHINLVVIVSFQIQSARVQNLNKKLTVYTTGHTLVEIMFFLCNFNQIYIEPMWIRCWICAQWDVVLLKGEVVL